jgi:outer membrane lipoprotein SlyB
MKNFAKIAAMAALALGAATASAQAACDRDASSETVLGAGSGALVGGLASHSVVGAAVGGVAGGLIGNSIGHANNREDCRREAEYYRQRDDFYRDRQAYNQTYDDAYVRGLRDGRYDAERRYSDDRPPDGYIGHDGEVHEFPD